MITKWNFKFSCSETASSIQDVFSEVGKRSCYGEGDRPTYSALNQLISGHSILNSHRAKIDKNVSILCETCQEVEDVEIFLFQCAKYSIERDYTLERTVEDILFREGCNDITCIDIRLLEGTMKILTRMPKMSLKQPGWNSSGARTDFKLS